MATSPSGQNATVSVVIPVRDRSEQLRRALMSLLPQVHLIKEVIVVDDRSEVAPSKLVDEAAELGLPAVLVGNERGPGAPGARNTGLGRATGSVVALLDSDDVWLPAHLDVVLQLLDTKPNAVAVISRYDVVTGGRGQRSTCHLGSANDAALLLRLGHGSFSCSVLAFRNCFPGLRFDESLEALQDYDFVLQLQQLGPLVATGVVTAEKYQETERIWNPERAARSRRYLMEKWDADISGVRCARRFQRWQLAYEDALVLAAREKEPPLARLRRHLLRVRCRLARGLVTLLRGVPI